ncbi:methyltransferase domain-containing protein [Streptomyces sp. B1866]|uniref:SAM-dependent methyltransferase n=1 Tax=Streptomyces sp. B1866 TaxID=3075431 RepID=UPI00288DD50A|nr:methyltransferase domain-containing protein [Streptomyces sp. B1866]MDT3397721.1 methyltransferase domain-containing protein [Streptomyces sp. B1866]
MTTAPQPVSPGHVADYYDRLTDLLDEAAEGNLHFGYWPPPHDGSSLGVAADRLTDHLIGKLGDVSGGRVLDVGCGSGKPAVQLARSTSAAEVVGVTISTVQVERATALARRAGVADRVRFECADAMSLPFPDESFDAVWALECMHHMPSQAQVLGEIARVLRPGGRLAVMDLVLRGQASEQDSDAYDRARPVFAVSGHTELAEFPRLVCGAGLHLEEMADLGDDIVPPSMEGLRQAVCDKREDFAAAFGIELDKFDAFVKECTQIGQGDNLGYVVLTAKRPGRRP